MGRRGKESLAGGGVGGSVWAKSPQQKMNITILMIFKILGGGRGGGGGGVLS